MQKIIFIIEKIKKIPQVPSSGALSPPLMRTAMGPTWATAALRASSLLATKPLSARVAPQLLAS